jgi:CHRD domain/Dockerin type I domain
MRPVWSFVVRIACGTFALAVGCAQAATPGLDARAPIGPFLNNQLPALVADQAQMPATLSATAAFADLATLTPHPGMVPFTVNAALWSDGADKIRWIALPFDGTVGSPGSPKIAFSESGKWAFPDGTVWVKHFQIKVNETSNEIRRLETRFVVRDSQGNLFGNSYKWRADGSDADLVTEDGVADLPLTITKADNSTQTQTWKFPRPSECLQCHNNANAGDVNGTGQALGVKTRHLNGDFSYASTGRTANQLLTWSSMGMLSVTLPDQPDYPAFDKTVALGDTGATLENRLRSYVDANCSFCHQRPGGPGPGWDARYTRAILDQNIFGDAANPHIRLVSPVLRRFDLAGSRLHIRDAVDPRVAGNVESPMPPLARNVPHAEWLELIGEIVNYGFDTTSALAVGSPTEVKLKFDRALDPASATTAGNYAIDNGIAVSAAALDPLDSSRVILTTSPMTPGTPYRVTVNRVREEQGVKNPIWPNTWEAFVHLSEPIAQTISFAAIADKFKGDAPFSVSATGGPSGNPVVFTSLAPTICTVSGTNGSLVTLAGPPGMCTIAANLAGNDTHYAAAQVTRSFKVLWRMNVVLEGSQQVPPLVTQAQGGGTATYDATTRLLALDLNVTGLESAETVAHVHGPAARGANAGVLINLNTGLPKVQTAMLDATQEGYLLAGQLYVNIHTAGNGSGEMRGQLDYLGSAGVVLHVEKLGIFSNASFVSPFAGAVCTAPCAGNPRVVAAGTTVVVKATADYGDGEEPSGVWRGCDLQAFSYPIPGMPQYQDATCTATLNASRKLIVQFDAAYTPSEPLNVVATPGNGQATISFAPPLTARGGTVTGYAVTCMAGMTTITQTGVGTPIVIPLSNGTTYACHVRASTAQFTGPPSATVVVTPFVPPALDAVKSRKTHRTVGDLDIDVALNQTIGGAITVEPRGGPHRLVFVFNVPVTSVGTITLTDKDGASTVRSGHRIVGSTIELPLDDLGDNQRVAIAIAGVNGMYTANAAVGFLQGDVNDSRRVTAADVIGLKARSGAGAVTAANARFDVNLDGVVSSADVSYVKNRSGRAIP